jgi:hypothetical protein
MSNFTVLHIGLLFKICLWIKRPCCCSWTWIHLVSMATVSESPQVTRKGHLTSWSTRDRPIKSDPFLSRLQGRIRREVTIKHTFQNHKTKPLCLAWFFVLLWRSRAIHKYCCLQVTTLHTPWHSSCYAHPTPVQRMHQALILRCSADDANEQWLKRFV